MTGMKISTVIFDLDGTLLDTLEDLANAANLALTESGFAPCPVDDYRLLVGAGARNLMLRAMSKSTGQPEDCFTDDQVERLLAAFSQTYASHWADCTRPYAGIPALLDDLRSAGIQLAVVSNKPDQFTDLMIRHFFTENIFSACTGKLDGWPIKPDPALTLEVCRRIGALPATAAMVGDSGTDMATAVNAGLLPVGVLWGFRSAGELLSGGARYLARDPRDLYNILAGSDTI